MWCSENGELMLEECPEGTTCSWDDANVGFECLPSDSMMAGNASAIPDGEGGGAFSGQGEGSDRSGSSEPSDEHGDGLGELSTGTGPTPEVRSGDHQGDTIAEAETSLASGCGASSSGSGDIQFLLVLLSLLFLLIGVRRMQESPPASVTRKRERPREG